LTPEEVRRRGDAVDALFFREIQRKDRRAIFGDMTTGDDDVMTAPLSSLRLATRVTNTLLNNDLSTIGDIVAKTESEIWQLPHLGPTSLTQIKAKLSALGLGLRPGPPLPKWK
jgi:DNA-directed RNA polymerase alpha subunit